jgi:hypothetical protein
MVNGKPTRYEAGGNSKKGRKRSTGADDGIDKQGEKVK